MGTIRVGRHSLIRAQSAIVLPALLARGVAKAVGRRAQREVTEASSRHLTAHVARQIQRKVGVCMQPWRGEGVAGSTRAGGRRRAGTNTPAPCVGAATSGAAAAAAAACHREQEMWVAYAPNGRGKLVTLHRCLMKCSPPRCTHVCASAMGRRSKAVTHVRVETIARGCRGRCSTTVRQLGQARALPPNRYESTGISAARGLDRFVSDRTLTLHGPPIAPCRRHRQMFDAGESCAATYTPCRQLAQPSHSTLLSLLSLAAAGPLRFHQHSWLRDGRERQV